MTYTVTDALSNKVSSEFVIVVMQSKSSIFPVDLWPTSGITIDSVSDGTIDNDEDETDIFITGITTNDIKTLTLSITDGVNTITKTPTLKKDPVFVSKLSKTFNCINLKRYDTFGTSIAIDNPRILVGTPNSGNGKKGAVYIFEDKNDDGDCMDTGESIKLNNATEGISINNFSKFGASVVVDNTRVLVGVPNEGAAGAVHILEDKNDDGDYADTDENIKLSNTTEGIDLEDYGKFGTSVATDGTRILVGAPYSGNGKKGAVYILEDKNDDGDYADTGENIKLSNATEGINLGNSNNFGASVAIDGTRILVGAPYGDDNKGTVYILEDKNNDGDYADTDENVQLGDLTGGISISNNSYFGSSIAIDDTRLLVGALYSGDNNTGVIYILEDKNNDSDYADVGENIQLGNRTEGVNLSGPNDFGQSVTTDGTYILVGAPNDSVDNKTYGAFYSFLYKQKFNTTITSSEIKSLSQGTITVQAVGTNSEDNIVKETTNFAYSTSTE